MTENEAIKTDEELGCEIACEIIAKVNEKSIEFEAKMMDVTLGKWGYCKTDIEKALAELEEYRKLGTVEECREAVEKTKAKKIKYYGKTKRNNCPTCKRYLGWNYIMDYCKYCGQRLESEE